MSIKVQLDSKGDLNNQTEINFINSSNADLFDEEQAPKQLPKQIVNQKSKAKEYLYEYSITEDAKEDGSEKSFTSDKSYNLLSNSRRMSIKEEALSNIQREEDLYALNNYQNAM